MDSIYLNGSELNIGQVVQVSCGKVPVDLTQGAWRNVEKGRSIVDQIVASGKEVYGVSTGVGAQKVYSVSADQMIEFNNKVLRGHGTLIPGPKMPRSAVRATLTVLANQFATGANGVRKDLVSLVLETLNRDDIPEISAEGSIGSADLTPLAQLAVAVMTNNGFAASAKEAVAFMNSNATSLGYGSLVIDQAVRLFRAFDLSAAMALEGFQGTPSPLQDAPVKSLAKARRDGAARRIRHHLRGSWIWQPGVPRFIQDPLSFRCVPAIHGAADRAMTSVVEDWNGELNVSNDNPMMDLIGELSVSHGNMESTAQTLALDTVRLLAAKLSNVSLERQHKLHWPAFAGLTEGLSDTKNAFGGVDFLNLGHIGSAFVGKVHMLSSPVLPISVGQVCNGIEDTSGFALQAVAQTESSIDYAWTVVTIEMIIAAWAVLHRGIDRTDIGAGVAEAVDVIRPHLPIGREGDEQFDLGEMVSVVRSDERIGRLIFDDGDE